MNLFQCLKESYVKALGIGIGFEVKRLNFMIKTKDLKACTQANNTELKVDDKHLNDWTFEEEVLDNHCIAVAVHNTNKSNENKVSSPIELFFLNLSLLKISSV